MNWNDERVELLRKLWAEGLWASQIAAQLGGVSRNAVIGKVHRLEAFEPWEGKRRTGAPEEDFAGIRRTKTVTAPLDRQLDAGFDRRDRACNSSSMLEPVTQRYIRPVENVVVPISRRLQLVQLSERTCKWPNGDPLSEDFSFCGNDSSKGPYCSYHSRIAFQPASERRRNR